jgi:hypothetical protein
VELRFVLPGAGHADWPALEWFAERLREDLKPGGPFLPVNAVLASKVELHRERLAGQLVLRAVPVSTFPPGHVSALLKSSVKTLAAASVKKELLDDVRMRWKRRRRLALASPRRQADFLTTASIRGDLETALPGALDALEAESLRKAVKAHLGSAAPVEIISEEVR